MDNRPKSREENVKTGKSAGIKRRGSGLGTGPVGNRTDEFIREHYNKEAKESAEEEKPKPQQSQRQMPHSGTPQPKAPQQGTPGDRGIVGDMLSDALGGSGLSSLGGLFEDSGNGSSSGNIGGFGNGGGSGNTGGSGNSGGNGRRPKRSLFSVIAVIIIIIIVIVLLKNCMCGGASSGTSSSSGSFGTTPTTASSANSSGAENYALASLLGGYDYENYYDNYNYSAYSGNSYNYSDYSGSSSYDLNTLLESLSSGTSSSGSYFGNTSSASWDANTGILNTEVASGAPAKTTQILGNGKDTVTVMVYICGSDLESSGGAATMDIQEMMNATPGDNVNIVLYTGGTRQWQNNVMSSSTNQIYQISGGNLYRLESKLGSKAMTDPNTLTDFIKYCGTNFPANRNILVLWDHGGGSVSGYAYDENYKTNGYMSLAGINKALKNAGMTFDIIGFDTCLMATIENALMLSDYADYLVASEEVEPGTGWYYTDWLSDLAKNPSVSSLELGKSIIDSFISASATSAYGIGCTLSMVDLKELSYTVPDKLTAFSEDLSAMLDSGSADASYKTVIKARTGAREFGESQSLDQIDLVNFADNIGTSASKDLSQALKDAVKYNLVSNGMSHSYGLSIFFPYNRTNYVKMAASIYNEIGFSEEYTTCIRKAANITGNGQSIYGSSHSSGYGSLFDALQGGNSYSNDYYSSDDISSLFSDMFFGRTLTADDPECRFLAENRFDASNLVWTQDEEGTPVISLPEEQWGLVNNITLNAFYDDGEGYYDLGEDNSFFKFNEAGDLYSTYRNTWLSIDEQLVAYYFDSMSYDDNNFMIEGHVPVLYNGERGNLLIVFDSTNPKGYIAGLNMIYEEGDTSMEAKTRVNLKEGDKIDFLADYYSYDGEYQDSYMIGDQWEYRDGAEIADLEAESNIAAVYKITDIYNNHYWTPRIPASE